MDEYYTAKNIIDMTEQEKTKSIMDMLSYLKNAGDETYMIGELSEMGFTNLEIIEIVDNYNNWCLQNEQKPT